MSAALTVDSLKSILGREVEEIHLTVAKSSVLGLDPETIANTLGVPKEELEELTETQDYKDIRLLVGAEQAKDRVHIDILVHQLVELPQLGQEVIGAPIHPQRLDGR